MAFRRARAFLDMIRVEHTVFALPFAYLGMVLAANGLPTLYHFVWITIAMAAARTVAMSANRIADRIIDAGNPRTASRPLVTGAISVRTAWAGLAVAAIVLTLAAYQLGPLPLKLLPGAFVFLLGYPFTKRFTVLSHGVLGFTDGLAPMGAWAAIRGSLFQPADLPAWLLLAIVTTWIAGFDILYACQDVEFDRRANLHAAPARYGVASALRISTVLHLFTAGLLLWLGVQQSLGWPYWVGAALSLLLLAYEHTLVKPDDLSQIDRAFFQVNSVISVTLLAATLAALLIPDS